MGIAGAEDQVVLHVLVQFGFQGGFHVDLGEDTKTLASQCVANAGDLIGEGGFSDVEMAMLMQVCSPLMPTRVSFTRSGTGRPPLQPRGSSLSNLHRTSRTPYSVVSG